MIAGKFGRSPLAPLTKGGRAFGSNGSLLFEIELIAAGGDSFPVDVLLDTGFTTGWLAINAQDIEALEWSLVKSREAMQTARGEEFFDIYAGKVLVDGQEFNIPVVAGGELKENLRSFAVAKNPAASSGFPNGNVDVRVKLRGRIASNSLSLSYSVC